MGFPMSHIDLKKFVSHMIFPFVNTMLHVRFTKYVYSMSAYIFSSHINTVYIVLLNLHKMHVLLY